MSGGAAGRAPQSSRPGARIGRGVLPDTGLLVFLAVILGVAAVLSPAFLRPGNIVNVLTQAAPLGMVAIGQTFALLLRGLDLSVASVMATAAVVATSFDSTSNEAVPMILAAAILLGLVVGIANGFLVAYRRVSPFLATLATMIVLQGLRFLYTQGSNGGTLPPFFLTIGQKSFLGLPIDLEALLLLALVLGLILHVSPFGRRIYMVGGSPRAASLVGINTVRLTMTCYILCSVIAATAGLFLVGYVGMVDQWTGRGYELDSIVAAVMGGVSISGGRGSIIGALVGVLILTVLFNVVVLLGLPVQVQYILKGVIVISASAFYLTRRGTAELRAILPRAFATRPGRAGR